MKDIEEKVDYWVLAMWIVIFAFCFGCFYTGWYLIKSIFQQEIYEKTFNNAITIKCGSNSIVSTGQ